MSSGAHVILSLEEADREGIGNKARRLARLLNLRPTLFAVPPGLVLLPEFSLAAHRAEFSQAIGRLGGGPFAVRSCGKEEDGVTHSLAGKFHTELFVPTGRLPEAIEAVRASFGAAVATSAVLIQPMIQPEFAGVMFTRSPDNHALASCEYSRGTADAVVSGRVAPTRVDYGRWSGRLYPASGEQQDMLSLVFLVGMVIEEYLGAPQDIEWAWDAKRDRLYVLQSRDVTASVCVPEVAVEQERLAAIAARSKLAGKGRPVFHSAAVREIVSAPTPLTRSLIERLYSPAGALGRSFGMIGLPHPKITQPYVTSLFGRLYAAVEVEQRLFGFRPALWWAGRGLRRKVGRDRAATLEWLTQCIARLPVYPVGDPEQGGSAQELARIGAAALRVFVQEAYPVAYAATLLAQTAREESQGGAATAELMRDLSRLHHTGDVESFLNRWGERSANDYELSAPRFREAPEQARQYAAAFANFPWDGVAGEAGFTHAKELAKDRAVRWLFPLRQTLLALERMLELPAGVVFMLTVEDIEALAEGMLSAAEIVRLCERRQREERAWAAVELGDEVGLEQLERLQSRAAEQQGLRGTMIAARTPFQGVVRLAQLTSQREAAGSGESAVLVTRFLEPELVGQFAGTAGCVADMGGALSHAAIVARELQYPILILPGSSSTLRDGDRVEVSAAGEVRIIRR